MAPRSTGCATCRRRKVKCDETRPACTKCITHKVVCPGYRGMGVSGIEFRDETQAVALRVWRAKRKDCSLNDNNDNSSSSSSSSDSSSNSGGSSSSSSDSSPENSPFPFYDEEIPRSPLSSQITRVQMFDVSMGLWRPLPTSASVADQRCHFSDFSILQEGLGPSSQPALLAAVDTLSLLQLGVSFGDSMLFGQARRRYGQALGLLVVALSRRDVLGDNDVLAAMKLLEYCELFKPIAQQGSWMSHVNGAEKFLARRGPAPVKTELEQMLFFQSRHSSVMNGNVSRKAIVFAEPKWMAVSRSIPNPDASCLLFDILVAVPGLYERADNLANAKDPATEATDLVVELTLIMNSMQTWLETWYASMTEPAYATVPVTDFETFSAQCKNRTFALALNFPNFFIGYLHSIYWLYMANVQRTLLDILRASPSTTCIFPMKDLGKGMIENYILLCQSFAYLIDPKAASMGRFSTFMPLIFAMKTFGKVGMMQEAKWCQDVAHSVYQDGISPPWLRGKICGQEELLE